MQIICRENFIDGQLAMLPGDEILLISERGINNGGNEVWFGQSMKSRKFGEFPRASVAMKIIPPSGVGQQNLHQSSQISNRKLKWVKMQMERIIEIWHNNRKCQFHFPFLVSINNL